MRYVGCDVHLKNTKVAWLDPDTGESPKPYNVPTRNLGAHLREMAATEELQIALETSTTGYFVARLLRSLQLDAIVVDLDARRHPFHVAIENWSHDMNIGSVVRTANAFLAAEVHIIGRRRWNRRGAMVTDRYQHLRHHPTVEDFAEWAAAAGPGGAGLPVIGVDNVPGSVPLEGYPLPRECVLVFGQEGAGLSDAVRAVARDTLSIAQFGSTRSINAGAAAAIAMHAWIEQHAEPRVRPQE